ncbi:MAG: hypothetical protein Q9201_000133 [Fulgogasparrea decipioides]
MAKGSKLLSALDAHRNVDHRLERQKKLQKQAAKRKRSRSSANLNGKHPEAFQGEPLMSGALQIDEDNGTAPEKGDRLDGEPTAIGTSHIDDSESESESSAGGREADALGNGHLSQEMGEGAEGSSLGNSPNHEAEDGIPLSDIDDLSEGEKADIIPHQRLTINNTTALTKAYNSIALPFATLPFSEHQTIVSAKPTEIPDVNDDLNRELVFHQQCLDAAHQARDLLKKEGVPFSRPADYFAEMVKSDEHMGKIKQKMTDEAANRKAAAEARKQRDLKRFGKQVQVAKLQERDKAKRETLDKINILKRKRKGTDTGEADETDLFDVALEDASEANRAARRSSSGQGGRISGKRQKKDAKYGFGGKKRFAKSGDALSSSDLRAFSTKKMKGQKKAPQRLGKSRRAQKTK